MIKLVFICALVAASFAAPQYSGSLVTQRPYAILRSENEIYPDGSYIYGYDTENGISVQEQGQQRAIGDSAGTVVQGTFQYTAPDGQQIQVQYIADENGFQPVGNAIPTLSPSSAQYRQPNPYRNY